MSEELTTPLVGSQSATELHQIGGSGMSEMKHMQEELRGRLLSLESHGIFESAIDRQRAARMLLCGALSGFFGFGFALFIGVIREQTTGRRDVNGDVYASGRGYFPSTVSEMVHDPTKPEGKTFFCFCFVGAVFIFMSQYPMNLRNVYIGDDAQCLCGVSWISLRQFVPAPGMMLLAIVTTTPAAEAGRLDQVCIVLHLIGAAMLFVGYFLAEAHCIGWDLCRNIKLQHTINEKPVAIKQRRFCLSIIAFFYVLFCAMQVVLSLPAHAMPFIDPKAYDQYGKVPPHDGIHLINSASWPVKELKVLSYSSEVICGIALIASHLVIWYHCEERHYDLPEELESLTEKLASLPNRTWTEAAGLADWNSEDSDSSGGLCA